VSGQPAGHWLRTKPPAEVVRDALAMAARKRRSGCQPCVEAYLKLALANGASGEQVAAFGNDEIEARGVGRAFDKGES
jgi:hypothetical protein